MNKQQQNEIKQAEADFRLLQKDQLLPPLMELKLAFLQALLTSAPETQDIGERLDPSERQSIEDMKPQTQQRLFIDIVRCLSGRDVITYCRGQRSYLRREAKFFSWQKCYLDCNTNTLALLRKRDCQDHLFKFELQRLSLSKYYKKYKGKYVLALDHEGIKYVIGFEQEITCKRIHKIIQQLVEQKRQWQATKYDNVQFHQQREAQRLAIPAHRVKQIMNQEEYQHLMALQQKVKGVDLLNDQGFKLHKNVYEGRVLIGKHGVVKTQLILKGLDANKAASCYIQMASWNPSVQFLQITGKPRTNCLLGKLRTKKYSMLSYAREATLVVNFFKPCQCHDQKPNAKSYLLIEQLQVEQKPQDAVQMSFKQLVQFTPNKQDSNLLLAIILTEANFKGYCSESDNLAMTLHLAEQIERFFTFANSTDKEYQGFFETVPCPCGGMHLEDVTDVSLPTEREEADGQSERNSLKALAMGYQINQKRVVATLEDVCNYLVNQQFLQIMKHHAHESYFLKHHFTQQQESIRTSKGDNINFLMEGIKWKLEGEELKFIDAEALAAQKDILKMIFKQLSSNIMQGKSIMNMSLPVEIFDKRTMLDIIADSYGFLPAYAPRIVTEKNPLEQIKLITSAFMFIHSTCPTVEKPFNPILGQTYQGKIGQLYIYLQQISHHPPISSLLIKSKQLQVTGNIEVVVDMRINSLYSYLCNWVKVKVNSTSTEYLIKLPDIYMEGIIYGDRIYRVINKGFILEVSSNLFCEFSIGKDKKRVYESKPKLHNSDLVGGIFKVTQEFADKVRTCPKPKSFEGLKPQQVVQTCCLLKGKWYGDLFFDEVCYKSKNDGPYPLKAQRMKYLLPSDCIWREDLAHKIWRDNEQSNREKERLQNLQRNDRKLRQKYNKSK